MLALVGALAGVPIANALVGFVKMNTALTLPLLERMEIDGVAVLFAAAAAIITGLASTALPALRIPT